MAARPSPRLRQPYSPRHPSPLGFPPLGFQPLPPHMAFVNSPSLYQGPLTPDRHVYSRVLPETRAKVGSGGPAGEVEAGGTGGGGEGGEGGGVMYPPEARRPLAGPQSRRRSQPPALNLNNPFHSQTLPDPGTKKHENETNMNVGAEREGGGTALQTVVSPPSPTPSDTSSLSLYSSDSVTKNFPVDVVVVPSSTYLQPNSQGLKRMQPQQQGQQDDEDERPPSLFCGCINFKAWFGGGSSSKAKENRILGPHNQPIPEPVPQTVQVRRRPTPLNL